jgi:hypothetical protein
MPKRNEGDCLSLLNLKTTSMKKALLALLITVYLCSQAYAQNYSSFVKWALKTSTAITDSTIAIVVGKDEKIGIAITNVSYANNYQVIQAPAGGWQSAVDTNASNAYLEFPFIGAATDCHNFGFVTCSNLSVFYPKRVNLTGYASSPVSLELYLYDTSNNHYNNTHKRFYYIGNFQITSNNSLSPSQDSINVPSNFISTNGVDWINAVFLRIYPTSGSTININNVSVSGTFVGLLPVHFISTNAYQQNNNVQLNWSVGDYINVQKFIIERSNNGSSFTEIGSTAAINSNNYTWIDNSLFTGNKFYRIKAINKDGSFVYSSIMKIEALSNVSFSIYPNPVISKQLNIAMNNLDKGDYQIALYNNLGQKIYTSVFKYAANSVTQSVQLPSNIQKGIYHIEVKNASIMKTAQIIIE